MHIRLSSSWMTVATAILALCPVAFAACPNLNPAGPKFSWDIAIWTYTGSLSTTGMYNGMAAWNAGQSVVAFCILSQCPGWGVDLFMNDNTSLPYLAETTVYSNYEGQSGCLNHPDENCTSFCFSANKQYYSQIYFNPTQITNTANTAGWSVDQVVEDVTSHEVGHTFGLSDYTGPNDCTNSTIMSSTSAPEDFNCSPQFYTPRQCDFNAVNNYYSGWQMIDENNCSLLCDQSVPCS